jgi:rod shape determining protein RodA
MVLAPPRVRRRSGGTDWLLLGGSLLAALIGCVMIYTATKSGLAAKGLDGRYFLKRQGMFTILGAGVMVVLSRVDYRRFEQLATPIYVVVAIMLVAVLTPGIGSSALGAQRWFSFGFIQIQPSEFMALALIIAMATYCNRRPEGLSLRDVSRLLVMAAFPIVLVLVQPDLGTVIIMAIVTLVIMAVAGLPGRILLWLLLGAVVVIVIAIEGGLLSSYQIHRLTSFLNQSSTDPNLAGSVYNVRQAKAAIGAGGWFGAGLGHGALTNLGYVPEQQTDFIFTAVGEQVGFFGTTAVLVLLGGIAYRIFRAAMGAKDMLGRLLCSGVFAFFCFSVFQNAGMTMGIMPVTGIPLPFFSYGGSATLVFFTAIGLVLSVEGRRGG